MAEERRDGTSEAAVGRSGTEDMFRLAHDMLAAQHRMLGLMSLTTEGLRLATRQAQAQLSFLQAMTECRDPLSLMQVGAEHARLMAEEAAQGWQDIAVQAQRCLPGGERARWGGMKVVPGGMS